MHKRTIKLVDEDHMTDPEDSEDESIASNSDTEESEESDQEESEESDQEESDQEESDQEESEESDKDYTPPPIVTSELDTFLDKLIETT